MDSKQKLRDIFAANFKKQLSLHNKTQSDICNDLGLTSSTVSDWANAKKYPRMDKVQQIADYLHILKSDLTEEKESKILETFKEIFKIPLFSLICCGNGLFVDDYIEDYIAIPDRYIKKGREYFANVASGDSMIGKSINDGDVLVFEKTNVLSNGDIGSFCIGDECVCKIFRQLNNGLIILESANDKYPPIEIDLADESQCFRIIGKLIATFKKY